MDSMKVRLTLTEEILGTLPSDPEIYHTFISSKGMDVEEEDAQMAKTNEFLDDEECEIEKKRLECAIMMKVAKAAEEMEDNA